jgi:hypothetical protein
VSSKQRARPRARAKTQAAHHALRTENYSLGSPDFAQPRVMVGRPLGEARKGKRYQIGIRVSGQVKAALARRAKENGRSLSSEIEHMIERAAELDRWLEALRMSLEDLERAAIDNALRRQENLR